MFEQYVDPGLAYHRAFSPEIARGLIGHSPIRSAYLSCWLWLRNPEDYQLNKLLEFIDKINFEHALISESSSDLQMFHNLLLWISLFDHISLSPPRIVVLIERKIGHFDSVLDLEKKVLWWLRLHKGGDKEGAKRTLAEIKNHRICKSPDYIFSHFISQITSTLHPTGPFSRTAISLQRILDFSHKKSHALIINLETSCISPPSPGLMFSSEGICAVLQALFLKKSLSFPDLLNLAFKFNFYDSFIHRQKVFNFISRLKTILPEGLELKTRDERVYVDGTWDNIFFQHDESATALLKTSLVWKKIMNSSSQPQKFELSEFKEFTRRELENIIGLSRSATHRYLKELIKAKKIAKVEQGRKTYYRPTKIDI